MSTIITITESPSMPGRFAVTHQKIGQRLQEREGIWDTGAAAAYAMRVALTCADGYIIFGPSKVMTHIPLEFRAGNRA